MSVANETTDKLSQRLKGRARGSSISVTRVLDYIDTHRQEVLTKSALDIAAAIGTSDATVIRAIQIAGFSGLRELRQSIAASFGIGQTPIDTINRTFESIRKRSVHVVDQVFADHEEAFAALTSNETRDKILSAIEYLASAKTIGVFGISSTAFLARYFALSLNRIGRSTVVFDELTAPLPEQLLEMRTVDVLVMIAFGKPFKAVTVTVDEARRFRVPIILISDTNARTITRHASVVVPVQRSHPGRIVMNGATLVCLEAIDFALTAEDPRGAIASLENLGKLRRSLG